MADEEGKIFKFIEFCLITLVVFVFIFNPNIMLGVKTPEGYNVLMNVTKPNITDSEANIHAYFFLRPTEDVRWSAVWAMGILFFIVVFPLPIALYLIKKRKKLADILIKYSSALYFTSVALEMYAIITYTGAWGVWKRMIKYWTTLSLGPWSALFFLFGVIIITFIPFLVYYAGLKRCRIEKSTEKIKGDMQLENKKKAKDKAF